MTPFPGHEGDDDYDWECLYCGATMDEDHDDGCPKAD